MGCARLERATPQGRGASRTHGYRRSIELLGAFDGTRAGHDNERVWAEVDRFREGNLTR